MNGALVNGYAAEGSRLNGVIGVLVPVACSK